MNPGLSLILACLNMSDEFEFLDLLQNIPNFLQWKWQIFILAEEKKRKAICYLETLSRMQKILIQKTLYNITTCPLAWTHTCALSHTEQWGHFNDTTTTVLKLFQEGQNNSLHIIVGACAASWKIPIKCFGIPLQCSSPISQLWFFKLPHLIERDLRSRWRK
jgi:hypothetical protein